jgi:hypothetical protein
MPVVGTASGTIIKVAVTYAPKGAAWIASRTRGKIVMVVGPRRAGKSAFTRYLRFGILQHAQDSLPTYDPVPTGVFNLRLGQQQSLEVAIKNAYDLPGNWDARDVADQAFQHRPHALVIVLDLTAPLTGDDNRACADWLGRFFERLDERWRDVRPKLRRNRLRSVVVAMNKLDLLEDADAVVAEYEPSLRATVEQHFKAAKGPKTDDVLFRRSVMVESPAGDRWINAILVDVAESMIRKR